LIFELSGQDGKTKYEHKLEQFFGGVRLENLLIEEALVVISLFYPLLSFKKN